MGLHLESAPAVVAEGLRRERGGFAWVVRDPETGAYAASAPRWQFIAEFLTADTRDVAEHEAVLLGVGPSSGALFGAVIHSTRRGQAQGGVRHWAYPSLEAFLRDGLRLSQGMTRKNALAHLWWGGGKGLIARGSDERSHEPGFRRALYREYGSFVSGLRGCYVTAEDVGTGPADMAEVADTTRFATCIPVERGGSGNPSAMTAAGVACAIDAALEFEDRTPADLRFAVQGGGNVGNALVAELLSRRAGRIVVSETDGERAGALRSAWEGRPVEVRCADVDDHSILAEPCDVLAPCALGGVLNPKTIPEVQARVVCGAANNPLEDTLRDAAALADRGITAVPDFVANRMGIVVCANEQYGNVRDDPDLARHLDRAWEGGIHQTTLRLLADAREHGITPQQAAIRRADALARELHPVWSHRGRRIIASLCGA